MTAKQAIEVVKCMPSSIMTKEDVLGLLLTMDDTRSVYGTGVSHIAEATHSVYGTGVSDIVDVNEDDEDEIRSHLQAQIEDAIASNIEFSEYLDLSDVDISLDGNYINVDRVEINTSNLIDDITEDVVTSLLEVFTIKNKKS